MSVKMEEETSLSTEDSTFDEEIEDVEGVFSNSLAFEISM